MDEGLNVAQAKEDNLDTDPIEESKLKKEEKRTEEVSEEKTRQKAETEEKTEIEEKAETEAAAAVAEVEIDPFVVPRVKAEWPVWVKISVITLAVLVVLYGVGILYFHSHFMWNTTLNGLNVSMMSEERAKSSLDTMLAEYQLEIFPRDGEPEYIKGSEIGLDILYTGSVDDVLSQQNVFLWFLSVFRQQEYSLGSQVSYDRITLYQKIRELDCMQKENIIEPIEPQIIQEDEGFSVEEGQEGRKPIPLEVRASIEKAISELTVSVDLDKEGCYEKLEYSENAKEIQEAIEYLGALQKVKITYRFSESEDTLTGDTLLEWIDISKDYQVKIDRNKIKEYIEYLKENYEMRGQAVDFQTSYHQTVEITSYIGSDEIDTAEETASILDMLEDIHNGGTTSYIRDASELTGIGNTYIEINLTSQHLYCYKNGEVILETDFVSGQPSNGHATPPGIFTIQYKSSPAILVGEDYRTPVSYWMPFNGGVGLHDATWQSAFGGTRYITNGSHGCINLPLDMAKAIYENYNAGDAVVVYHLAGTESGSATPAGRPSSSPIPVVTEAPPAEEPTTEAPAVPQPPATEAPIVPQPPATEIPATETPATEATTTENSGENPPAEAQNP